MNKTIQLILGMGVLLGVPIPSALARILPAWGYEKLLAAADVVVIIEALEVQPAKDEFPKDAYGAWRGYEASNARFRVRGILKNNGEAMKELTVLHFHYPKGTLVANGAQFIRFPVGPITYEKRPMKDGKVIEGSVERVQYTPQWLAFLKRRPDGRYEPVSGQYDACMSFEELRRVSADYP
jgi:hypothetical protein